MYVFRCRPALCTYLSCPLFSSLPVSRFEPLVVQMLEKSETCDGDIAFLQVGVQVHSDAPNQSSTDQLWAWPFRGGVSEVDVRPLTPSGLAPALKSLEEISKGILILVFLALALLALYLQICGLPKKARQDSSVKSGCPASWMIFLSVSYAFIWFTTDQSVPSLPQMGDDLLGSQSIMSAACHESPLIVVVLACS